MNAKQSLTLYFCFLFFAKEFFVFFSIQIFFARAPKKDSLSYCWYLSLKFAQQFTRLLGSRYIKSHAENRIWDKNFFESPSLRSNEFLFLSNFFLPFHSVQTPIDVKASRPASTKKEFRLRSRCHYSGFFAFCLLLHHHVDTFCSIFT